MKIVKFLYNQDNRRICIQSRLGQSRQLRECYYDESCIAPNETFPLIFNRADKIKKLAIFLVIAKLAM